MSDRYDANPSESRLATRLDHHADHLCDISNSQWRDRLVAPIVLIAASTACPWAWLHSTSGHSDTGDNFDFRNLWNVGDLNGNGDHRVQLPLLVLWLLLIATGICCAYVAARMRFGWLLAGLAVASGLAGIATMVVIRSDTYRGGFVSLFVHIDSTGPTLLVVGAGLLAFQALRRQS